MDGLMEVRSIFHDSADDGSHVNADQRASRRLTLILRAGKLTTPEGEFLCVLRDISSGGIKVRLFHPLAVPPTCEIEFNGQKRHRLVRVWHDKDNAGFRFVDGPLDINRMLEEAGPFARRSIRLRISDPPQVSLHVEGRAVAARLLDISQHGAALSCDTRLAQCQKLEVSAPRLTALTARVRWRRADRLGLVFEKSFRLDELAQVVALLQGHGEGVPLPLRSVI